MIQTSGLEQPNCFFQPCDSHLKALDIPGIVSVCICTRVYAHVHSVVSDSLRTHGLYPVRLLCPWDSPGKNTGVGCHALLQGIFTIQGSNLWLLCLLHWQADSLSSKPLGKPVPGILSCQTGHFSLKLQLLSAFLGQQAACQSHNLKLQLFCIFLSDPHSAFCTADI